MGGKYLRFSTEIAVYLGNGTRDRSMVTIDHVNVVVRQYCRDTETEDQARMYQFMRDLTAL